MRFWVALICAFSFSAALQTAGADEFPVAIQDKLDSGDYTVGDDLFVNQFITAFTLTSTTTLERQALLRYRVSSSSDSADGLGGTTQLYGLAWGLFDFEVPVGSSATVTYFMEQVQPIEYPVSNFLTSEIIVQFSEQALLAGGGSFSENVDGEITGEIDIQGILFCLSDGCSVGGAANLLGIAYVNLDGDDDYDLILESPFRSKNLLLSQFADFPGFDKPNFEPAFTVRQNFVVGNNSIGVGDVNMDGVVNLLDVSPFVEAILSGCYSYGADANQDGQVSLLDVSEFIALVLGV